MIKQQYAIGLLCCCFGSCLSGVPQNQPVHWDTVKVWSSPADFIASDHLDYFYRVTGDLLIKHDAAGDSLYSWSSPASGRITRIDVSDPLRILVYHPDFNIVRFLNNRLAPLADPVKLDDAGIVNTLAICMARQGGFWVLDGSTLRLKYFDKSLDPVIESAPLTRPPGSDEIPPELTESGDKLYLNFPGREIQVFDLFGNYIKRIPIRALSINIMNNLILYVTDSGLFIRTDPMSPDMKIYSSGPGEILQACLQGNILMVRLADRVLLLREEK